MSWILLINVACIFLSWWVASTCKQWGIGWWANMFASALNGVIVLKAVL